MKSRTCSHAVSLERLPTGMMSDGVNQDPADKVVATQTQVPWCAGGRAFRFFMAKDLSLKSDAFCCETSISALATMSPEEEEEKRTT